MLNAPNTFAKSVAKRHFCQKCSKTIKYLRSYLGFSLGFFLDFSRIWLGFHSDLAQPFLKVVCLISPRIPLSQYLFLCNNRCHHPGL